MSSANCGTIKFLQVGMKVKRKLSDFFAEKQKRNENMKTETKSAKRKRKFFGGRGNGNRTAFSGVTDAKTKNTEFLFYSCFAWLI
jgi:hypothetical protein